MASAMYAAKKGTHTQTIRHPPSTSRMMDSRFGKIPTTSVRRRTSRFNRSVGLFDHTFVHTGFEAAVNAISKSYTTLRDATPV